MAGVPAQAIAPEAEDQEAEGAVASQADAAATDDGFEEVVVTAQRVEQRLLDVPVSVTAITSEEIQTRQILAPVDIGRLSPNVKLSGETGGTSTLRAYIRGGGITDGGFILSESEVALYTNDVYNARLQGALVDFAEIERIEVLRGPQGVLYGRNASAGAINIITKAPAREFTGSVEAGIGTWWERRLKGYVSVPLDEAGDWAISAAGMVRARDGGYQYNETLDKKVGEQDFHGGQVDLIYRGNGFEARGNLFYMNSESDGQWAVNTVVRDDGKIVPASGSYRRVGSPYESFTATKQKGGSLHLSVDYAGGTLKSITGYSELDDKWGLDFSGGVPGDWIGEDPDEVFALFTRTSDAEQSQFSQELQAAGGLFDGFLDYVVGLYYFHEKGEQLLDSSVFFAPATTVFNAKTDAYAAYGQFTLNLSDRFQLIAGGRYTKEDKELDGSVAGTPAVAEDSFKRFSPKFGVNYKPNKDILLYASYSEGFKAGGYSGLASTAEQLATPFKPQVTKAYEAGVKADLGRRLRGSLTGFLNKIQDRQQTVNLNDGGFLIENYDVEISGIELEFAWRPVRGLQIWGNGALNWGKYLSTDSSIGSLLENDPPSLPDYEFTIGADYSVPLGDGELKFGGDFNQRDNHFSTADNVPIGWVKKMDSLNAYVSYRTGPWNFQVAGKNLLQQQGWITGFGFSVINPRFMSEPRTVLATARYSF